MAATLVISQEAFWMPTGWIFRAILRDLSAALTDELPEHAKQFARAIEDGNLPRASIEDVTAADFRRIVRAAEAGLHACFRAGPGQFEPQYRGSFFGLATRYATLVALLRLDERAQPPAGDGLLVFSSGEWRAPRWAFDLVRAHLIAGLSADDRELESLRAGLGAETEKLDLRGLSLEARHGLVTPALGMAASFGAGATDAVAEDFHTTMAPLARALRDLVLRDAAPDEARSTLDTLPAGVSLVGGEAARRRAAETEARGGLVVAIPEGLRDEKSFVAALRKTLPLEPPPDEDHDAWYVLQRALERWVGSLPERDVLFVWPDAGTLRRGSERDFDIALLTLNSVATSGVRVLVSMDFHPRQ